MESNKLIYSNNVKIVPTSANRDEKSPFIQDEKSRQQPVSLTPSWEAGNKPNEELNFKGLTMDRAKMEICPPHDRLRLVFFTFILHGLGTLMPWNMFITAKSYFVDFKLNTTISDEHGLHVTDASSTSPFEDINYATNFLAYIGFASQIPNVIFNWLNIFINMGGDLTKRIVWSISIEIVVFIVTVILAMVDSSSWPGAFFWITMVSVIILNMANGVYQNTVYGMVATLPIKYTGAVVLGSNISGLFTSLISLASNVIFDHPRTAAIYYFITAMFVLLLCFDTYFALPLNRFYRYNELMNEKESKSANVDECDSRIPYWTILKKTKVQLFNIFMIFFVTLAVFPAVHSDIKPSSPDFFIPSDLYVSITCFLTFNLFAMLGSLTTSWIQWPSKKFLIIPVLLRLAFIPLFLFCKYYPKDIQRTLPVYIDNDWAYWIIAIIMSYTSGYLSSLGMMYAPQCVQGKYQVTAGMFAAAMLITGIFSGILLSGAMPTIISSI